MNCEGKAMAAFSQLQCRGLWLAHRIKDMQTWDQNPLKSPHFTLSTVGRQDCFQLLTYEETEAQRGAEGQVT